MQRSFGTAIELAKRKKEKRHVHYEEACSAFEDTGLLLVVWVQERKNFLTGR